jgi:ABC-2 type transport system permease protein
VSATITLRRVRRLPLLVPLNEFTYRFEVATFTILVIGRIFLFAVLWHAVYEPGEVAAGMTVEQAVAYSTLAAIIAGHGDVATIVDSFTKRVREGTVAYLFIRPVSPIVYVLGLQAGGVIYRLGWLIVTALIGIGVGIVTVPASAAVLGWSLLSLLLAEAVMVIMFQFIELVAFWTIETHGITAAYAFTVQLLSGALVPLWFFPTWARTILLALPFAAAASTPLSLYVGRIPVDHAPIAVASQAVWLVVLAVALRGLWRVAQRRVIVQGG